MNRIRERREKMGVVNCIWGIMIVVLLFCSPVFGKTGGGEPKNHEIHLLSGSILIPQNAPPSLLFSKQRLLDLYRGSKKRTSAKTKRKAWQEVKGDRWIIRLMNLYRPKDMDLQSVCDEYISTVLQMKMRLVSRRLKKLVVEMQSDRETPPEKCQYSIKQRIQLVPLDGRALSNKKTHAFQGLRLKMGKPALYALLSRTRRQDIKEIISDYMIIVPVKLSDSAALGHIIRQAARKINRTSKRANRVVRFMAFKSGSARGKYLLPGLPIMAFTKPDGKIILVKEVKYQVQRIRKPKTDKTMLGEFVTVHLFNTNLAMALAAGNLRAKDSAYGKYSKKGLYEDAREALNVAGRYAATQFDVSNIVVVSKAAVPGSRFGVRVPVSFESKNGDWVITNRRK